MAGTACRSPAHSAAPIDFDRRRLGPRLHVLAEPDVMQWRAITSLGRPYYLLFSGGILSDIGSFTTQTALILHIYG